MIDKPDFSLPDPQRTEFEKRYKGMEPPHFRAGDVTMCRPMTKIELAQYKKYRASLTKQLPEVDDYQQPF